MTRRIICPYLIKLTCGCTVRRRDSPASPKMTFPCPSNLGHGYRVAWAECTQEGVFDTRRNRLVPGPRPMAEPDSKRLAEPVAFDAVEIGDALYFTTERGGSALFLKGTVTAVREKSVSVESTDGSVRRLDRSRWASRSVRRAL